MTLWRVEVAGVSHRFVDADSKEDAVEMVTRSVLEALDLRVAPAAPVVRQLYAELAPKQRKQMIAALDGLTSVAGRDDARRARRRLARQVKYDFATREWLRKQVAKAPPIPDPELMRRLLISSEGAHVRRLRQHLREFNVFD
jgi:hypothetical protein